LKSAPSENDVNASTPSSGEAAVRAKPTPAGRITAWTSRGILTAVILVAGLSFGRQVLQWWRADETGPIAAGRAADSGGLLDPSFGPVELRFGDLDARLAVRKMTGAQSEAAAALRAMAVETMPRAAEPTKPALDAERRLVAKLANEESIAEKAGSWRLHALSKDVPVLIGIRLGGESRANGRADRNDCAESEWSRRVEGRIALWAVGVPSSTDGWTLYTFLFGGSDAGPSADDAEIGLPSIPLPPGAKPTMSLGAARGTRWVAFGGKEGDLSEWRTFYDRWFAQHGWSASEGWRERAGRIGARFRADARNGEAPAAVVDLWLWRDAESGRPRGIVLRGGN
jgi:hypothetical protein